LVIYAEGDPPALRRQGQLLDHALRAAGVQRAIAVVPGSSHTRIILTLSRGDTVSARAMLRFVASLTPDVSIDAS
jgi:acetyl esterase/lipase